MVESGQAFKDEDGSWVISSAFPSGDAKYTYSVYWRARRDYAEKNIVKFENFKPIEKHVETKQSEGSSHSTKTSTKKTGADYHALYSETEPVLNVYDKDGDNVQLGNMYPRKVVFTYGDKERERPSIEHAYQTVKLLMLRSNPDLSQEKRNAIDDLGKRMLEMSPRSVTFSVHEAQKNGVVPGLTSEQEKALEKWMETIMITTWSKEPEALLATGRSLITHKSKTISDSKWTKLFPEILMRVRKVLRIQHGLEALTLNGTEVSTETVNKMSSDELYQTVRMAEC